MGLNVETIQQGIQLLAGQGQDRACSLLRPVEPMLFKSLVVQTEAIGFPEQDLDTISFSIGEYKELTTEWT
jgi:hypothetical protein